LPGRRAPTHVALDVELALLAIGRGRKRHHLEDAVAYPLRERSDEAALARGIAALENDDDALAGLLDPLLEEAELGLKLPQLLQILFPAELLVSKLRRNISILGLLRFVGHGNCGVLFDLVLTF